MYIVMKFFISLLLFITSLINLYVKAMGQNWDLMTPIGSCRQSPKDTGNPTNIR
jgi:hypothetical protein